MSVSKAPGSTFRMATEETSAGLQVIDTVLWLLKRMFDGKDFGRNSAELLNWVLRRAYQHDFSFAGVGQTTEQSLAEFMDADLSETRTIEGAKLQSDYEEQRRKAMDDYTRAKRTGSDTSDD